MHQTEPEPDPDPELKTFSCLTCRSRKVKCDRRDPCSNCARAGVDCRFVPPVRGKRKRVNLPRESLHAKLERYESLLRLHGVKFDLPVGTGSDCDDSDEASEADEGRLSVRTKQPAVGRMGSSSGAGDARRSEDPYGLEESRPVLITGEGASRYVDSALWSGLGHEVQKSELDGLDEPMNGLSVHDGAVRLDVTDQYGLLLQGSPRLGGVEVVQPPASALDRLRELYTDRVDSMMKILHLPTFWTLATEALQDFDAASRGVRVLICSFYLATVSVLDDEECQSIFGAEKSVALNRSHIAARQALIDAKFLSTSSPVALQAFALFMVRTNLLSKLKQSLSGVAIRLARKMGLHRDGLSLGLSVFDTEMRRRLWWHLAHADFRMSESLSLRPMMDTFSCDAKMPLNVLDEDLKPEMMTTPEERNNITPVAICLIRCELIEFLRQFVSSSQREIRWDMVTNSDMPLAEKDRLIDQFEDRMERQFLRYCDLSNNHHNLVSIAIRSSICKMKIYAHNPRRYANSGVSVPQSERDIVFSSACKTLEYATLLFTNAALQKYMWHASIYYICNNLLYVLIEARHRKTGPEIDRLWHLIGLVLSRYSEILTVSTGAVYAALRKWIVEVWDEYVAARQAAKLPTLETPDYVDKIRRAISAVPKSVPELRIDGCYDYPTQPYTESSDSQLQFQDGNFLPSLDSCEFQDFSDILSFETNLNQWLQWEQLTGTEMRY